MGFGLYEQMVSKLWKIEKTQCVGLTLISQSTQLELKKKKKSFEKKTDF